MSGMRRWGFEPPPPLVVDPIGCGCTECIVGEYIPADCLSPSALALIASGYPFRDNSNGDIDLVMYEYLAKET